MAGGISASAVYAIPRSSCSTSAHWSCSRDAGCAVSAAIHLGQSAGAAVVRANLALTGGPVENVVGFAGASVDAVGDCSGYGVDAALGAIVGIGTCAGSASGVACHAGAGTVHVEAVVADAATADQVGVGLALRTGVCVLVQAVVAGVVTDTAAPSGAFFKGEPWETLFADTEVSDHARSTVAVSEDVAARDGVEVDVGHVVFNGTATGLRNHTHSIGDVIETQLVYLNVSGGDDRVRVAVRLQHRLVLIVAECADRIVVGREHHIALGGNGILSGICGAQVRDVCGVGSHDGQRVEVKQGDSQSGTIVRQAGADVP